MRFETREPENHACIMGLRGGASRWAVVFIHQQAVGNRVGSCDKVSLPTQIRHLLTVGMTVGDGLRPAECHTHGYIQDALAGMEQSHPLSSTTIAYLWRREPFGVTTIAYLWRREPFGVTTIAYL